MSEQSNVQSNEKFATLVNKARGTRSIRAYAEASGVSPATISRIIRGDYIPKQQTIRMLTSQNAEPQNGVTFLDLMIAAGYQDRFAADLAIDHMIFFENADENKTAIPIEFLRPEEHAFVEGRGLAYGQYILQCAKNESMVQGILASALISKGYEIGNRDLLEQKNDGYMNRRIADVVSVLKDSKIQKWYFEIKNFHPDLKFANRDLLRMTGWMMFLDIDERTKYSLVVSEEKQFDFIVKQFEKNVFRGELSVILVDIREFRVVKEKYVSHYYDDDCSSEIYLV